MDEEPERPRVLPPIPAEEEARADYAAADNLFVAVVIALAIGTFFLFTVGGPELRGLPAVLALLTVAGVILFFVKSRRRELPPRFLPTEPGQATPAGDEGGLVLDYQRVPPATTQRDHSTWVAAQFCAGLAVGPTATLGTARFCACGGWLGLPIAIALSCQPVTRAFGAGMLVGIGVGFVIILSTCGGYR